MPNRFSGTHWSRHLGMIALSLCCASAATALRAETVVLDPVHTAIEFTLGDLLHAVHGTFKLKSGIIHFDPGTGKASGSVEVDAASGNSRSGERDKRMHENILESDRYPEVVFTPDRLSGKPSRPIAHIQVHGVFRIHGADHAITLPFEVQTTTG